MTTKTTTSIELQDIKAIEFECATCHTKVVLSHGQVLTPAGSLQRMSAAKAVYCP